MARNVVFANRPTRDLVARAQRTLGMTHRAFGEALGASERTAQRWARHGATLTVSQLRALAALVHPYDSSLAAELAEATSETLESLGIAAPPAPPVAPIAAPPALPPRPSPVGLTEAVVCAAADEMSAVPSAVRGILLVAFRTAREHGLTVEEVEQVLAARAGRKGGKG